MALLSLYRLNENLRSLLTVYPYARHFADSSCSNVFKFCKMTMHMLPREVVEHSIMASLQYRPETFYAVSMNIS